jgi:hypothetical protein
MTTPQELASGTQLRDRAIERWAESQIAGLIEPGTSLEERQRRIHRLTEGPPEFVDVRVDLPRNN